MAEDYKERIKLMALDEETFVRLTMRGKLRARDVPWRRVIVRPVLIKNERHLQFSYFNDKQDITKNYAGSEASQKLDEVLAMPFSTIHVQSTTEDIVVQITKKGKAILHRSEVVDAGRKPNLAHDLSKNLPLPVDTPDSLPNSSGSGELRRTWRSCWGRSLLFVVSNLLGAAEMNKQDIEKYLRRRTL